MNSVNNLGKKNGITLQSVLLIRKILEDHQFVLPLRKGMDPAKNVEKLSLSVAQTEEKSVFAESVCVSGIAFGFLRF